MNTIKFAPYDDFVTEQHDVEHASVDTVKVGETEYRFYNPCNLNVFITNTCQNACDFCINKGQTDQFRMGDSTYYEAVFHPNGNLCASWIDKERILDPYYIDTKLVKRRFGDTTNLNAEK